MDYYEKIKNGEIKIPKYFKNDDAKDLIHQLLSLDPNERLNTSFDNLKTHPFFTYLKWVII